MIKNQIMSINAGKGFDSRLIVFLNYQGIFLVFSKAQIDVYDSTLALTLTYSPKHPFILVCQKTPCMRIIATTTSPSSLRIKTSSSATIDIISTGKIEMFDLLTGDRLFFRDSRTLNPSDNYALEDVSGIHYDFLADRLYTGNDGLHVSV